MNSEKSNKDILEQIELLFSNSQEINGCPVCSILMDFEFNLISKIQYAITEDKKVREEIAAEGGFCDFHFRQFKKIANGKTNIQLLKSIIETGAYGKKDFVINCRICKKVDDFEMEIIKTFLIFIQDENAKLKFEKSHGICFEHLKILIALISDSDNIDWLYKTNINQIESLQPDFEDMSKIKSFYEIERDKRKLINILIEKLAGRKTRSL